ncbi:MAG: thiol-disulfide oxidoreductase DCC family protein [Bacteroidetes bacterium]|nr:MAG: thiol-disulfide oxidoreductase DCC family protein [Bacteroidota bacterium]
MNYKRPIILFDGVCNFCNGMVNFIIRQDKKNVFLFAALQSESGKKLLEQYHINWQRSDSFVVIENDKAYMKSNAALKLYAKLPWYWKWTQIFWIVPKFIRDWVYNVIARNRYKWFGKEDECMVPSVGVKERFLN